MPHMACFFGSSKCLQDCPRKKELQPVSGYDVNMLLEIDSRRVVYRLDLAELKSAILMRRRHEARSSTIDAFLLISRRF